MDPDYTNAPENALQAQSNPLVPLYPTHAGSQSLVTTLIGSCIHCRRRKVRCDKSSPCSNCVRFGTQCELAPRKRAPRRARKTEGGLGGNGVHTGRELELMRRLNKLEGMVKEMKGIGYVEGENTATNGGSLQREDSNDSLDSGVARRASDHDRPTKRSSLDMSDEVQIEKDLGTLMLNDEGRSRYVSHNWIARLSEEVDDLVELMFDDYKDKDDDGLSPSLSPEAHSTLTGDDQSFIFGYSSSRVNLRDSHPLPSQLPFFLQTYTHRVDPLIKILHVPTLRTLFTEAQHNLDALARDTEALLFAVYFAVITSMTKDECKASFGMERKAVYDRYRFGVEQALARASFLDTTDLTTVQAFVLYLSVVRCEDESRVSWALTRSAIGVAQTLGLHRDGANFDLSPFDIEMRRRCWWQLCILDFRLSDKHGTEPSIMAIDFDTKRPLNINDADVGPSSTSTPEERVGLTEMTLTLIATEIAQASFSLLGPRNESLNAGTDVPSKELRISQFCQLLITKYAQHCSEPNNPMAWTAKTLCALVICKMESILLLPLTRSETRGRDTSNKAFYDKMFLSSICTVELRRDLEAELTKHWHWYLRTVVQWHAIAYLLSELCVRNANDDVTRAWKVLDTVFKDWRDLHRHNVPSLLTAPMQKLIARARQKRAMDLEALNVQKEHSALLQESSVQQPVQRRLSADFFPGTEHYKQDFDTSASSFPYTGYATQWLADQDQTQVQEHTGFTPTPWLLEDSALEDLGIDLSVIDSMNADMQWDGFNDLLGQLQPGYDANTYGPFGNW